MRRLVIIRGNRGADAGDGIPYPSRWPDPCDGELQELLHFPKRW